MKTFISALIASVVFVQAPVALAADDKADKPSTRTVDLNGLVLPVEQDGRLVNYLFISARLTIADGFNHWKYREKGHIIRDAILREAHRTPLGVPGSPMQLDSERAKERIRVALSDIMEPDAIAEIDFVTVDSLKIFTQVGTN